MYLVEEKGVVVVGAGNSALEVIPARESGMFLPLHECLGIEHLRISAKQWRASRMPNPRLSYAFSELNSRGTNVPGGFA